MTTRRRLLLVHGRDFKPEAETYLEISTSALRAGFERDCPELLGKFDALHTDVAWYGDINAEVLRTKGRTYDEALDVSDRRNALAGLREYSTRKKFSIRRYDCLPGKSALPEFVANFVAPAFGAVGLCMPMLGMAAKDFRRYFDRKSDFCDRVRTRLREKLCEMLARGEEVVLMSHGTGSVVAYDVLWQLSHEPGFSESNGGNKIVLWMTLGAPLGDTNIRKRLLGAKSPAESKFPLNVIAWHNVSAEDDYTCHDNTIADDFRLMLQRRVVSAVHDHKILNLAVRYGRSNPHSSVGYFIHPRVTKILADWLAA